MATCYLTTFQFSAALWSSWQSGRPIFHPKLSSELSYWKYTDKRTQSTLRRGWTGAHIWAHTHIQKHTQRNVWMFFSWTSLWVFTYHILPWLNVSWVTSLKVRARPILTALWSQPCCHCSKDKTHTSTHERTLNQVNCRAKLLYYATAIAPLRSSSLKGGLEWKNWEKAD